MRWFILTLFIIFWLVVPADAVESTTTQKEAQQAVVPGGLPSVAQAGPSADQLRETIRQYIQNQQKRVGAFIIPDSRDKGKLRTLTLVRVHERVGKTGDYYYSCTDMKDIETGDELDLDFDIADTKEELKVVAVRIHKDNGKPRYTYDANDNLIPLSE